MKVKDFINGKVTYDKYSQYFFIDNNNQQMLAVLRGWGAIQALVFEENKLTASDFQDEIGNFIAEAINEKLEREQ